MTRQAWIAKVSVPSGFSPGAIISQLNYGTTPKVPLREELIDAVIKYTTINTVEGTYLIRIGVEWDDPQSSAWFANALADAIIDRAQNAARESGGQISSSLSDRLTAKKAELNDVIARSRTLKQSIGVVDIDRQKQSLLEARIIEQSQLTSDRASLKASQGQVAGLQSETSGKLSPAQQQLEQSLAIERPRAAGLGAGIAIREKRVADIDTQITALGRNEDAVKSLDALATSLQAEVAALNERTSFSEIENLANAPRIELIERAVPPLVRSSPKILLNTALGFVAGCALAGCALLLLGGAPTRRRDEEIDEAEPVEPEPTPAPEPAEPPIADPLIPEPSTAPPMRRPRPMSPPPPIAEVVPLIEPVEPLPAPPVPVEAIELPIRPVAPRVDVGAAPILAPVVAAPPVPAPNPPAAVAGDDHLFSHMLPPPTDGRSYNAGEQAAIAPAVAAWLAGPLAADGRPVLIASDKDDRGAQTLYRLLYRHLRQQGVKVVTLDATDETSPRPAARTLGSKPLIYGGGLGERGRGGVGLSGEADMVVVMAAMVAPGENATARAQACRQRFHALVQSPPYVIAIAA